MERRWITVKECAEYCDLHIKSVYLLITKGHIPAAKIGGSIRVDLKRLEELLESAVESALDMKSKVQDWGF
jgi:excisionase family DNA binding protein